MNDSCNLFEILPAHTDVLCYRCNAICDVPSHVNILCHDYLQVVNIHFSKMQVPHGLVDRVLSKTMLAVSEIKAKKPPYFPAKVFGWKKLRYSDPEGQFFKLCYRGYFRFRFTKPLSLSRIWLVSLSQWNLI